MLEGLTTYKCILCCRLHLICLVTGIIILLLSIQFPGPNSDGLNYLIDRANKFGNRFFKFSVQPFRPTVMLCHPDTVKHLLKREESKTLGGVASFFLPWLGKKIYFISIQVFGVSYYNTTVHVYFKSFCVILFEELLHRQ